MNELNHLLSELKKAKSSVAATLEGVKVNPKSSWGSTKMWMVLSIVCALIFLAHGNLAVILDPIMKIVMVWLVCHTFDDLVTRLCDASVKKHTLTLMAKDGLTESEAQTAVGKEDPLA